MDIFSLTMKKTFRLIALSWILAAELLPGQGAVIPNPRMPAGTEVAPPATEPGAGEDGVESAGEKEMRALAAAFPDRVEELARRRGEWTARVDGSWYAWAEGRLLPEELRERWREFSSYRFYSYHLGGLPPLPRLDEDARLRLKQRLQQSAAAPPLRHPGFLDAVYAAPGRAATEALLRTVRLMGFEVRVHERIAAPLKAIDRRLTGMAESDPEVRNFIQGLVGLAGYNWRAIAGTRSRSYHSYGLAVDLEPASFGGRHTYWRWALDGNEEWYAIPYDQRWLVPTAVVSVFEEQGFIWGGKWLYFDTMHFEYRPEILLLARRLANQNQADPD
jgi:hypothetical protein